MNPRDPGPSTGHAERARRWPPAPAKAPGFAPQAHARTDTAPDRRATAYAWERHMSPWAEFLVAMAATGPRGPVIGTARGALPHGRARTYPRETL